MKRNASASILVTLLVIGGGTAMGADPAIDNWGSPPGSPPPWQTADIWVDNDGDWVPDEPGEPSKGIKNRLFAMVRNLDPDAVDNVSVWFGYAPYGFGYPHTHFKEITTVTGVSLSASGSTGDEKSIEVEWDLTDLTENNGGLWPYPVDQFDHFCVRVVVSHNNDSNGANNDAQNNFTNVELSAGESGGFSFMAVNPGERDARASMIFSKIPREWQIEVGGIKTPSDFVLKGGEQKLLKMLVTPTTAAALRHPTQPVDVALSLDGKIVGGFSFVATAKKEERPCPGHSGGTIGAYLIGTYDLRDANTILHIVNPTAHRLLVLVVFFDDDEERLRELWFELTPNDMEEIDVRRADIKAKLGVVKIVSFDPKTKEPKIGLVGYRRYTNGSSGVSESILHAISAEVLKDDLPIITGKGH